MNATFLADIKDYVARVIEQTKAFVVAHLPHWGLGAGVTLVVQWLISHSSAIVAFVKAVV
jgi:hypothetical protein